MSYVTVNKGKLNGISPSSNLHGVVGGARINITKQDPLGRRHLCICSLATAALLTVAIGFNPQPMLRMLRQFRMRQGRLHLSEITQHRRATQWKQSDC